MTFYPATEDDQLEMLKEIGVKTFEDLVGVVPEEIRLKTHPALPAGLSEYEALKELRDLAGMNRQTEACNFLGAGSYDHYIPSAVSAITGRSEFYTAYTPYQAEVSQGTLQAIYEYQTMICRLTGMDVSNASMYDGASSLAEAVLLSAAHTGRKEIVIAGKLNPDYRTVMGTYCKNQDIKIVETAMNNGVADLASLADAINSSTAAVVTQHPNFYGCLEDVDAIGQAAGSKGALYISVINPVSLGILKPPAEYGADIVVGEGQPLGIGLNFGGPYLGIFTVKEALIRKIPGRISGITADREGKRGFVLTLQTREQQIRRERATSNICTNQGLMMLAATVYMSLLGREGIRDVARQCLLKSHYLAEALSKIPGCSIKYKQPFFNEFVLELPQPAPAVVRLMAERGILAGVPLGKWNEDTADILIAVTEKRTKDEMDKYTVELKRLLS